jgi:pteridine reductase
VEFAARNPRVRVNCVLPGGIAPARGLDPQDRAALVAGTLVKREGRPAHVAHAVLFLLENDHLTGVCLPVDGGLGLA